MKLEKNKKEEEELIDIDENGNPIETKQKPKPKKSSFKLYIIIFIMIIILIILIKFFIYSNKKNRKNLFDKTELKNLKLKNRVISAAMFDNSLEGKTISETGLKKYEELAKNHISIILTGGTFVSPFKIPLAKGSFRIDTDEYIDTYKPLIEKVHKYDSYIFMQLSHAGLHSKDDVVYSPSINKCFSQEKDSIEMSKEDIIKIEEDFVNAAIRAKKAGFDGIDIHGAHLTLISSFFSTKYNRRKDEYGGSDENRARFLVEIIKKIREKVGDDFVISVKLDSGEEKEGISDSGFLYTSKMVEAAGVDLITVSGTQVMKDDDIYYFEKCKKLAENIKIPVACVGGIKTYEHADFILNNSKVEYISIARALMKEPDLIIKWENKNKDLLI